MKPAASLSARLLAPKGTARPAIRHRSTAQALRSERQDYMEAPPVATWQTPPAVTPVSAPSTTESPATAESPVAEAPAAPVTGPVALEDRPELNAPDIGAAFTRSYVSPTPKAQDAAPAVAPESTGPKSTAPESAGPESAGPAAPTKTPDEYSEAVAVSAPIAAPAGDPVARALAGEPGAHFTRAPVGLGPRVAMTLRLDHDEHLQLKLFSARSRMSSQEILTKALRQYLEENAGDGTASKETSFIKARSA